LQFELENLKLFDPIAQDKSGFTCSRNKLHTKIQSLKQLPPESSRAKMRRSTAMVGLQAETPDLAHEPAAAANRIDDIVRKAKGAKHRDPTETEKNAEQAE
jgi:hypothetical protein